MQYNSIRLYLPLLCPAVLQLSLLAADSKRYNNKKKAKKKHTTHSLRQRDFLQLHPSNALAACAIHTTIYTTQTSGAGSHILRNSPRHIVNGVFLTRATKVYSATLSRVC